jgi:hypothetical protein
MAKRSGIGKGRKAPDQDQEKGGGRVSRRPALPGIFKMPEGRGTTDQVDHLRRPHPLKPEISSSWSHPVKANQLKTKPNLLSISSMRVGSLMLYVGLLLMEVPIFVKGKI